jgi:hypothetical protein
VPKPASARIILTKAGDGLMAEVWSAYDIIDHLTKKPRTGRCGVCTSLGLLLWRTKKLVSDKLCEEDPLSKFWIVASVPPAKDFFLAQRKEYVEKKCGGDRFVPTTFTQHLEHTSAWGVTAHGADFDFWKVNCHQAMFGPGGLVEDFRWNGHPCKGIWRRADTVLLPVGAICRARRNQTEDSTQVVKALGSPSQLAQIADESRPMLDLAAKEPLALMAPEVLAIKDEAPRSPYYPLPQRTYAQHSDVALQISVICKRSIPPRVAEWTKLGKTIDKVKSKTQGDKDDHALVRTFWDDIGTLTSKGNNLEARADAYKKLIVLILVHMSHLGLCLFVFGRPTYAIYVRPSQLQGCPVLHFRNYLEIELSGVHFLANLNSHTNRSENLFCGLRFKALLFLLVGSRTF